MIFVREFEVQLLNISQAMDQEIAMTSSED